MSQLHTDALWPQYKRGGTNLNQRPASRGAVSSGCCRSWSCLARGRRLGGRRLGRIAAHTAPGIVGDLGVGNLLQRVLVLPVPLRLLLPLLGRLAGRIRKQVDMGTIGAGRACARAGTAATSPINAVIAATPTTRMECSLILYWPHGPHRRSDLHAFAGAIQSSQIGPHLVQPPSASARPIKPMMTPKRRNMAHPLDPIIRPRLGAFQAGGDEGSF